MLKNARLLLVCIDMWLICPSPSQRMVYTPTPECNLCMLYASTYLIYTLLCQRNFYYF